MLIIEDLVWNRTADSCLWPVAESTEYLLVWKGKPHYDCQSIQR